MTTECEHMLAELEEKILKWQSAREAGEKADASDREKADLKMVEEEYLAFNNGSENAFSRRVPSKRRIGLRGSAAAQALSVSTAMSFISDSVISITVSLEAARSRQERPPDPQDPGGPFKLAYSKHLGSDRPERGLQNVPMRGCRQQ